MQKLITLIPLLLLLPLALHAQVVGEVLHGKGYRHFRVRGVEFNMVKVEGGTYYMGAGAEQHNPAPDEKPLHPVKLSTFYIGETEVTQALWEAVTRRTMAHFQGNHVAEGTDTSEWPVESVTWEEAMQFVKELNRITGEKFRLPTEAQWEYAARGGKHSKGYEYAGSDDIGSVARYGACIDPEKHGFQQDITLAPYVNKEKAHPLPVASYQPNELGLYDMSGNVSEWTSTLYGPYPDRQEKNPKGPMTGSEYVYRGGCWYFGPWSARVAARHKAPSRTYYINLGFRLAM